MIAFSGVSWVRSWEGVYCLPVMPFSQLDQLVIDSAVEKREMERKHAAIQQRVRPCSPISLNMRECHHHSTSLIQGSRRHIHKLCPSS